MEEYERRSKPLREAFDTATAAAKTAFISYRNRMHSDRDHVTDEDRIQVERLADEVMNAEGALGQLACELGLMTRSRTRGLVRKELWDGLEHLEKEVWDAQLRKVELEREMEITRHRALAKLHEVAALQLSESKSSLEMLQQSRKEASEFISRGRALRLELSDLKATPDNPSFGGFAIGGGMGGMMMAPKKELQLDPLDPQVLQGCNAIRF